MNITDVRVFPQAGGTTLRAFANVTLDGAFAVHDLKIVDGKKGLFVSMPSRKLPDGKYRDLAFPVTRELREEIQSRVLGAYLKAAETPAGKD